MYADGARFRRIILLLLSLCLLSGCTGYNGRKDAVQDGIYYRVSDNGRQAYAYVLFWDLDPAHTDYTVADTVNGRDLIVPIEQYGVKMLSIGFFVDVQSAVVWRGGMASNAIKQLINDAEWGELDYFLIDLPPGTSDIHLTLIQTLQLTGAIVVTTPQDVALVDARKGVDMFTNDKVNVPVLGLVENMSYFTPAELPDNKYYIFGRGGGKRLAEELQIPLLGEIPLVQSIREGGDQGTPIVLQAGHPAAQIFMHIAAQL